VRRLTLTPFGAASRGLAPEPPRARVVADLSRAIERFDLGPEHVALALEAATWAPDLDEGHFRAALLALTCLLVAEARGSTRMPVLGPRGRDWLERTVGGLLPPADGAPAVADDVAAIQSLFADAAKLDALVGPPGARRPLVLDGEWLYSQKLHAHELSFVDALAARLTATPEPAFANAALEAALASLRERPSVVAGRRVRLSSEQEAAVRRAASAPLTLVSGGPGTGKTSIVVSILRLLSRLGVDPASIALAAPTGKAAQRMTEAVGRALHAIGDPSDDDARLLAAVPEGLTLHRLLGYSPGRGTFAAHAGNRLEHRVVIVDEASMIDMVLMERLVRAVRGHARLVLLGDADQLPSVGAGAVLRDLVTATPGAPTPLDACAVRLTQSYRMDPTDPQGAAILTFARLVNGDPVPAGAPASWRDAFTARAAVADLTFAGVEVVAPAPAEPRAAQDAFVEHWQAERLAPLRATASRRYRYTTSSASFDADDLPHLEALFRGHEAARLLCFTRGGRAGTHAVNAALHRLVLRARGADVRPDRAFVPGEPVLVLANDYDKGLWNGDQGVTLWVSSDHAPRPRLMAVFRRGPGFVAFHLELLREQIERCYAMTVHKAQGSEFDHVAVLLPEREGPLLVREVLYTAVTRARRSVTLLGAEAVLAQAAERRGARFTGVRERARA
jgi:exodeoxyribonuclease V alpha subunit